MAAETKIIKFGCPHCGCQIDVRYTKIDNGSGTTESTEAKKSGAPDIQRAFDRFWKDAEDFMAEMRKRFDRL